MQWRPGPGAEQVVQQQRREQEQCDRARDARPQRPPAPRRRAPAPRGHDHERAEAAEQQDPALGPVDRVGGIRARERDENVVLVLVEQQPDELEEPDREHEEPDEGAVYPRPEAAARDVGQQQRHERDRPVVVGQHRKRLRGRNVDLREQREQEEAQARGGEEQAAPVVRPAVPGDEAAGGDGAPAQPVHDLPGLDGLGRAEDYRHERAELGGGDDDPQCGPEAGAAPAGGEPAEYLRAAAADGRGDEIVLDRSPRRQLEPHPTLLARRRTIRLRTCESNQVARVRGRCSVAPVDRFNGLDIPESLEDALDPATLALVVYDMQVAVLAQVADRDRVLANVLRLLTAARERGVRTVFMRHWFMPTALQGVYQLRQAKVWQRRDRAADTTPLIPHGSPGVGVAPELAPRNDEPVIDQVTMSAFEGTPLDIVLRDCGVRAYVIAGVALEVGIEPTVRHSADLG